MASDVKHLRLEGMPPPNGAYSHAARYHDLLFISGQLPDPVDAEGDFDAQTHRAIGKMLAILEGAGGKPEDLLKVTAYIVGVVHWPAFDRIFAQLLGSARPARVVVPVPELHYGFLVEIDAVAALSLGTSDG